MNNELLMNGFWEVIKHRKGKCDPEIIINYQLSILICPLKKSCN
jgi:hypothetical protein